MSSLNRLSPTLPILATALLALAACDPGTGTLTENTDSASSTSGGETEGDTSTSAATATEATSSPTTTDGGSGTDATSSSTTTDATSSPTTTDATTTDATTGEPAVCDSPNLECEQYELDCEVHNCGAIDSYFDIDGCPRPACSDASDCADDEICYAAINYGGCASSGIFCGDDAESMSCQCGGDDDCNGAYCVPAELVPDEQQIGPGSVTDTCAPDDGPAFDLEFGLESAACDAPWTMNELRVRLVLTANSWDPLPPGEYSVVENNGWGQVDLWGDDGWQLIDEGTVTIESWEGGAVTGSIELHAQGLPTIVSSFTAPHCVEEQLCG